MYIPSIFIIHTALQFIHIDKHFQAMKIHSYISCIYHYTDFSIISQTKAITVKTKLCHTELPDLITTPGCVKNDARLDVDTPASSNRLKHFQRSIWFFVHTLENTSLRNLLSAITTGYPRVMPNNNIASISNYIIT